MLKLLTPKNILSASPNKCGEIFYIVNKFTITCTFCEMKSFHYDDFLQHLQNVHLENYIEETTSAHATNNCIDELEENDLEYDDVEQISEDIDFDTESSFSDEELLMVLNNTKRKQQIKKRKIGKGREHDINNETSEEEFELSGNERDTPNETSISITKKLHKAQDLSCPDCQKIFPYVKDLTEHVIDCHNGYKCSQCDKRYRLPHHKKRHELTHQICERKGENMDKVYTCNGKDCMKLFTDPEVLKRHLEVHTTKTYNFMCDFENCGKAFETQNSLTAHKRVHRKIKNFICDTCGYGCRAFGHFIIHQHRHTGEKPFACEFCERCFVSAAALKQHMITHSTTRDYVCEICEATFANNEILKRHRFIHSDKRTFQCKLCDKTFKQPHSLHNHIIYVHKEPKPRILFIHNV